MLINMMMDAVDQALLLALRENARMPVSELARRLGRSRTTVQSRIARLERSGVISGYALRLAAEHTQAQVRAHLMLMVAPKGLRSVESALRRRPELLSLHAVSGRYDLIAVVAAPGVTELDRLIDEIGALEGVERTTSSIILSTKFER
jgi:DNA-binding Lrp family transcriptional regulator